MTIQDFSLELTRKQSLAVGASGGPPALPYFFGNNPLPLATVQNTFNDLGQGQELCVEFEVTTAFTGYVGATQIPHLIMGVCLASGITFSIGSDNIRILSMVGWNLGGTGVEMGLQPSDSESVPALKLGDRYYCKLPGGVLRLPYIANTYTIPSSAYLGVVFLMPMCTGQTVQMSPAAIWTATDFTAGAITARLAISQPTTDGIHHYAKGMVVK